MLSLNLAAAVNFGGEDVSGARVPWVAMDSVAFTHCI